MTDTKKPRKELKRTELRRKTPMKRAKSKPSSGTRTGMMRRKSSLPKANPERQAKRRKSYEQKLAAYKRSATYKAVEQRAAGQCERIISPDARSITRFEPFRCERSRKAGDRLTHNHKTYARFGGNELPEDVELLCDGCNAEYEAQHSTRNRNYSRSQGGDSR